MMDCKPLSIPMESKSSRSRSPNFWSHVQEKKVPSIAEIQGRSGLLLKENKFKISGRHEKAGGLPNVMFTTNPGSCPSSISFETSPSD